MNENHLITEAHVFWAEGHPVGYMPNIEKMARFLCCRAFENPEMIVARGVPAVCRFGYSASGGVPNWQHYVQSALDAIDVAVYAGLITQDDADKFLG
jgi:hypothetical protein